MRLFFREAAAPTLALFASGSTLLCCALPAFLVTIGAGAAMAGLAANVPGLVWLTANKGPLFAVAGALLLAAGFAKWATRNAPCPTDPALAAACGRMRRLGTAMLLIAAATYTVGFFFAFFAARLFI